jgi:hypothetical protein
MVYTINTRTQAVSHHTLAWHDVLVTSGVTYGLTSGALVKLSGVIEVGAEPFVQTGEMSLAGGQLFNLPKLSLGGYSLGDCEVTLSTKEHGSSITESGFVISMSDEMDQHELILGTHQQARTYQVKLGFSAETKVLTLDGHGFNPVRPRRA